MVWLIPPAVKVREPSPGTSGAVYRPVSSTVPTSPSDVQVMTSASHSRRASRPQ